MSLFAPQAARVVLAGSGHFVPPFEIDNKQLAKIFPTGPFPDLGQPFDWGPAWIESRLGITARRLAFDFAAGLMRPGYYDLDLGEHASRLALLDAGLGPENLDAILYVTSTPEFYMPDPACLLHERLGARPDAAAFGLTSVGCGGFVYAMILAHSLIASRTAGTVLVTGAVSTSSYGAALHDPGITPERRHRLLVRDRVNASLFGDGAGAVIMRRIDDTADVGVRLTWWGANGRENPVLFKAGGSRFPATVETVLSGMHSFSVDLRTVRRRGLELFEETIRATLHRAGVAIPAVDHFIFHQVNQRLLRHLTGRLGVPWDKLSVHVDRYGNLDTAALPVAYDEAKCAGRIKPGDLILFAAVGAGWQYGAVVLRA